MLHSKKKIYELFSLLSIAKLKKRERTGVHSKSRHTNNK